MPAAPRSNTVPRCATARSASVTDWGAPTASMTYGNPPINITSVLVPTTRPPAISLSSS